MTQKPKKSILPQSLKIGATTVSGLQVNYFRVNKKNEYVRCYAIVTSIEKEGMWFKVGNDEFFFPCDYNVEDLMVDETTLAAIAYKGPTDEYEKLYPLKLDAETFNPETDARTQYSLLDSVTLKKIVMEHPDVNTKMIEKAKIQEAIRTLLNLKGEVLQAQVNFAKTLPQFPSKSQSLSGVDLGLKSLPPNVTKKNPSMLTLDKKILQLKKNRTPTMAELDKRIETKAQKRASKFMKGEI